MSRVMGIPILGLAGLLAIASSARGQSTPYIGLVYPAGGQQGTTVQVRLGGQRIDGIRGVTVSGQGVSAKLVEYRRVLSNQEVTLIREQARELKRQTGQNAKRAAARGGKRGKANQKNAANRYAGKKNAGNKNAGNRNAGKMSADDKAARETIAKIEKRIAGWVNRPACRSLAAIAVVEVTIAPDAKPGPRELRLLAQRGVSNPMVFHVGQVPEVARKAMRTCVFQVLGKEALAQRKRPPEEEEETITVPCTMNGQIASGEVNRYRFEAMQGQQLVVSVNARQLIPYIADAVPGWFQPVVTVHDADGKEVAFSDDYRFDPDPTFYFEVPEDGEYVLSITDAIYRGREDFVYRITIGQVPFLTSIFPLGGRVGEPVNFEMEGWNLQKAKLAPPSSDTPPGVHRVAATRKGFTSNSLPFAVDTLPECFDEESNNDPAHAQKVTLPIIVNGRSDKPDDWDVFAVEGRAGDTIVAEVQARRLDSPMDSMLKLTDSAGTLLAFNDDNEDVGSGLNTHHADSYLTATFPADGTYYVHLGDTTRNGGKEYAYRLRISQPQPDFALRVVSSGVSLRRKGAAAVTVYAIRKDGFSGNIRLSLKDPPPGYFSSPVTLASGKESVRFGVKTRLAQSWRPVALTIQGEAAVGGETIVREAVPADDRMQAFLWRHLVPAQELLVFIFNPSYRPPETRVPKPFVPSENSKFAQTKPAVTRKFTKRQVAGRLRQLKALYEEWLITDEFYNRKVAECEASL